MLFAQNEAKCSLALRIAASFRCRLNLGVVNKLDKLNKVCGLFVTTQLFTFYVLRRIIVIARSAIEV